MSAGFTCTRLFPRQRETKRVRLLDRHRKTQGAEPKAALHRIAETFGDHYPADGQQERKRHHVRGLACDPVDTPRPARESEPFEQERA